MRVLILLTYKKQLTLWLGCIVKHGTRDSLLRLERRNCPKEMKDDFNHSQLIDDFWSEQRGRATTRFRIY